MAIMQGYARKATKLLVDKGLVPADKQDAAIAALRELWQGEIGLIWNVEDVKSARPDLDDDQCFEVLCSVELEHDADLGVSWDTLKNAAAKLFGEQEEEEEEEEEEE